MKTFIAWFFILMTAGLLAGCATADSGAATTNGPKISGYVDTSAGKHF
ncbi:MAG TPA: hypothetical protein VH598_11640 [Verrucomicrobiae bacterium]|nr:hypothetical protein [Verrucomicrobiae bacterium]